MNGNLKYQFSRGTVFRHLGDVAVVINLETEEVFHGNSTAAEVLEMVAQKLTLQQMTEQVLEKYEVSNPDGLGSDIGEILNYLLSQRMVESLEG